MIEVAIFSLLTGSASISEMVDDRVYPMLAPQNVEAPYIVFQRISSERWRSLSGPSGMAQPRIQIDVYHTGYADCKNLAAAVRQLLDGYRGTVEGVRIGGVSLINDIDFLEEGENPKLFRVSMDFLVTHEE